MRDLVTVHDILHLFLIITAVMFTTTLILFINDGFEIYTIRALIATVISGLVTFALYKTKERLSK